MARFLPDATRSTHRSAHRYRPDLYNATCVWIISRAD